MVSLVNDVKNTYPIPTFYYWVTIGDIDSIAFSEASGLSFQDKTITYKDGVNYRDAPKYMSGSFNPANLTLKKGLVSADSFSLDWFKTVRLNTVLKIDVHIDLLNENGETTASWTAKSAFPTKLNILPSFDVSSDEVTIESLELTATLIKVASLTL